MKPVTLKRDREFQQVYRRGKSVHTHTLVLFYLAGKSGIRTGFIAGKKVGKAVQRNRAKRRMRALFADRLTSLAPGDYVLVAKATTVDAPHDDLQKAFISMLRKSGATRP